MIKVEKILNKEWPNHKIHVHLFGYCYVMFIVKKIPRYTCNIDNYYLLVHHKITLVQINQMLMCVSQLLGMV